MAPLRNNLFISIYKKLYTDLGYSLCQAPEKHFKFEESVMIQYQGTQRLIDHLQLLMWVH